MLLAWAHEAVHERGAEADEEQGCQAGVAHGKEGALLHAEADAVEAACAEVLAGEGGHGVAEAHEGHHGEGVDAHGCRDGCHRIRAESVQGGLDGYRAESDDRGLEAHGGAHADEPCEDAGGEVPPVALPGPQEGHLGKDEAKAEQGGEALGADGGERRALHAHAEAEDEGEVEDDVDDAGDGEEEEGRPAVAEGRDGAGEHVVEHGCAAAAHHDGEVGFGAGDDVGRRVEQGQQGLGIAHAEEGHGACHEQAREDGRAEAAAQPRHVLGAEALGEHDGKALRHAHEKAEHEEEHAAGGADAGEGVHANGAAHDERVHHAVDLLEKVAEQQGKGKAEDQSDGAALGEVFCHGHLHCRCNAERNTSDRGRAMAKSQDKACLAFVTPRRRASLRGGRESEKREEIRRARAKPAPDAPRGPWGLWPLWRRLRPCIRRRARR